MLKMIKLKKVTIGLGSTIFEHTVIPTIFPDGTSQVWKLPTEILEDYSIPGKFKIIWYFESEGELIHLMQLRTLLFKGNLDHVIDLVIPYLPYARQDKPVSNETTFALRCFLNSLGYWNSITTVDIHSTQMDVKSLPVDHFVQSAISKSNADFVCFPDAGAAKRGYEVTVPSFNLDKKRNQLTGQIEGLVCSLPLDLKGKTILLVDDICDGGRTFIEASGILYGLGAHNVDLYVTHGIFSKGIHLLREMQSPIRHIYTTNSYIKSQEMLAKHPDYVTVFKLEE
jgi:phosphoribosylpyrophosphate synthetase